MKCLPTTGGCPLGRIHVDSEDSDPDEEFGWRSFGGLSDGCFEEKNDLTSQSGGLASL